MATKQALEVGDSAPDFTLTSATGVPVSLHDFRGRSEVILFFYPKANTPFCTAEACAFRDNDSAFRDAGAEVIGISSDPPESLRSFGGSFQLPYTLLSDPEGKVRQLFGVPKTFGILPGRSTYLIDRDGIVRHIFTSQFLPSRHATDLLEALKSLQESK